MCALGAQDAADHAMGSRHQDTASRALRVGRATRTALFIAMSGPLTQIKLRTFQQLACTSPYDLVIGYDTAGSTASVHSITRLVRYHGGKLVPMSNSHLIRRYSEKILNFNGEQTTRPAKLAALDWFAHSDYEWMWHLEDDTWSGDFGAFAGNYEGSSADLVIRGFDHLPFWADSGWRIGQKKHVLTTAHQKLRCKDEASNHACGPALLSVSRTSRTSSRSSLTVCRSRLILKACKPGSVPRQPTLC